MRSATLRVALQVVFVAISVLTVGFVLAKEAQGTNQQVQPLSGLDKMLKQASGVKVDAIIDNKLASNVSDALNDMAQNLRKMFVENRRLNMQVQELFGRVQNATGVNATNTLGAIQQQAANMSNVGAVSGLNGQMNLNNLMQRFGQ